MTEDEERNEIAKAIVAAHDTLMGVAQTNVYGLPLEGRIRLESLKIKAERDLADAIKRKEAWISRR